MMGNFEILPKATRSTNQVAATRRSTAVWRTLAAASVLTILATGAQASQSPNQNKGSSEVIDGRVGQTNVSNFALALSNNISRFGGNIVAAILNIKIVDNGVGRNISGASAGEDGFQVGTWTNFATTHVEETFGPTEYEGTLRTYMLGADHQFTERLLAGFALGRDTGEIETRFNTGTLNLSGETISPYVAYRYDDQLSFDGLAGYSGGGFDQVRAPAGTPIFGDTNYDRYFIQGNANYVTTVEADSNIVIAGKAGLLYALERVNGFTESNGNQVNGKTNPLTQVQLAARAGYSFFDIADNWVFHPYTQVRLLLDLQAQGVAVAAGTTEHPNDDNEGKIAFGVDVFAGTAVSGNLEFVRSVARKDFNSNTVTFNLRWVFN